MNMARAHSRSCPGRRSRLRSGVPAFAVRVAARFSVAAAVAVAALGTALPAPAGAQILNTLRGWSEIEQGWAGNVEATLTFSSGNSEYLESALGAALQYRTSRNRVRWLMDLSRRTADGAEIAEERVAHLRHNWVVRSWVSSVVFVQIQDNPFQRLARRILLGGGVRFDVVESDDLGVAIGVTVMREWEDLTDDDAATVALNRGSLFVTALGTVGRGRLDASAFYQPRLNAFSDERALAATSLTVDLIGDLAVRIRLDLAQDSRPPDGVEQTDVRFRSGLVFSF